MSRGTAIVAAAVATAVLAFVPSASADVPPTTTEFIAQADGICEASNAKNLRLLKRAHAQIGKGRTKAGARTLIRAERFELRYYGRIAALPRPADPAFNDLVDRFLRFQRGQAKARIKLARALLAGRPNKVVAHWDNRAIQLLKKAGKVSRQIGFTHC